MLGLTFHRFLLLSALVTIGIAAHASAKPDEKVAVLVSGGDLGSLEESMQSIERQAISTYESLGFKVIIVGGVSKKGAPLSPESLNKTLSDLQGVKDLRLDFIGHGSLQHPPDWLHYTGSEIPLSDQRRANSEANLNGKLNGKIAWFAANESTADSKYYGRKASLLGLKRIPSQPIDQQTIETSLSHFRDKNPDALTTINLLNCFSGALAQDLRTTPNTIVYDNSPINFSALDRAERTPGDEFGEGSSFIRTKTGLGYYYDAIGASKELTLNAARTYANSTMRHELLDNASDWYMTGRSPIFESVIGWCESNKPGALTVKNPNSALPLYASAHKDLENEMSALTSNFEYARNLPYLNNPEKKAVDEFEEWDKSCRAQSENQTPNGSISKTSTTQSSLAPVRLLFEKYDQILNDPAKSESIYANVKKSLERDKSNLVEQKIPEDRWGSIKDLIDGIESGTYSQKQMISSLKQSVAEMKKDCSRGEPNQPPCLEHFSDQEEMAEFLILPSDASFPYCPDGKDKFKCLFSRPLDNTAVSSVLSVWNPAKPQTQSIEEKCAYQPWVAYNKTATNLELDRKCLEDFENYAPDPEWQNLLRIKKLGERNAQGRDAAESVTPTKIQNTPSGTVK